MLSAPLRTSLQPAEGWSAVSVGSRTSAGPMLGVRGRAAVRVPLFCTTL